MVLEVQGLEKRFGSVVALHGIDLRVGPGEVVGFLGPNGAGKSTTMKIVCGVLRASAGRVRIGDTDLEEQPLACRRRIGYLPQDLPLYPDMTVGSYLQHIARLKGIAASQRRHEVLRVMQRCDVTAVERRHIHKLSGGNRQRVGLAQALLGSPQLLVLDEPTAGLDPAQVANFRELIAELATSHSILLSTHILPEVQACCGQVVLITEGRKILDETTGELLARSRRLARVRLRFESSEAAERAAALPIFASAERPLSQELSLAGDDRQPLIAAAVASGGLQEVVEERRSLEDVFRELIAAGPKVD